MADLLWSLVTPVLTLAVMFFVLRFFFSALSGVAGAKPGGGKGGGGGGMIAVGWVVSAMVKVAGAVALAVLNGLVLPLLGALGRGASSGWRAGVTSTARRASRPSWASASPWTSGPPRAGSPWADPSQAPPERPPSIFERRFWWATAEEVHFERWERDHHKSKEG